MIRIAYVDDNMAESDDLKSRINGFIDAHGAEKISVEYFTDAINFLSDYKYCYDIIFIDPQTSGGNGHRIIDELRKIDPDVVLVFMSQTAEYALYGYTVNAVGYLLKTAGKLAVKKCLERAFKRVRLNNKAFVNLARDGVIVKVSVSKILYIEKFEHSLVFHTEYGKFNKKLTLRDVEEEFEELGFLKCNRGMMVNSHYVQYFTKREVNLGSEVVPISRGQYDEFAKKWQNLFKIQG